MAALLPNLKEEALLWEQGGAFVFGVDEAGRGCLAGPVCAAVTAWSATSENPISEVRDSKKMTEQAREKAFGPIQENALAYGVGFASAQEIDRWNILRANYLAVARALEHAIAQLINFGHFGMLEIDAKKFAFLSDGNHPLVSRTKFFVYSPEYGPEFPLLQSLLLNGVLEKCIVKGDSKVFSIASASVLAKVSRDRRMHELDKEFPAYAFAEHKGYSTAKHVEKLREAGPCSEHRMTFAPVAEAAGLQLNLV